MAAESWWSWPLSSGWLSSGTACFLLLNALVGVVAVLSWGRGGDVALSTRRGRLTRSASSMVMERLRSVSSTIFSFQYPAADHDNDYDYDSVASPVHQCTPQEEGETRQEAVGDVEPELAVPLVECMAATTVAQRIQSAPVAVAGGEVCAAAPAPTLRREKEEAEARGEMSTPGAAAGATEGAAPSRKWKVAGIAERRAFAEMEDKAEVNARAERFIRQFREDLKLERLNSILNSAPAGRH